MSDNNFNSSNNLPLSTSEYEKYLNGLFENSFDFVSRTIETITLREVTLFYISTLIDNNKLDELVIQAIINTDDESTIERGDRFYDLVMKEVPNNLDEITNELLSGKVLIHIDGQIPYLLKLSHEPSRDLSEPQTEYQVFGPKIGFVENIDENIGMLRYFIKDANLHTIKASVGKERKDQVAVAYIDSLVEEEMVSFINEKVDELRNKKMVTLGGLTRHFQNHRFSLFPQCMLSERMDQAKEKLLQGKFIIFFDHHSFSIITPIKLTDSLSSTEDESFTVRWNQMFIRTLRLISVLVGSVAPAFYVALVAFHPELIPTTTTLTIAASRSEIPLRAATEALAMLFALDILVEASIRLPSFVGQTIGIVGGLVIGTAAAEAQIVSNVMVVTIALTAIATFTSTSWEFVTSWRIIRYLYVFVAATLGLYGLMFAFALTCIHLCKLESLNKQYVSPFSPFQFKKLVEFFFPST